MKFGKIIGNPACMIMVVLLCQCTLVSGQNADTAIVPRPAAGKNAFYIRQIHVIGNRHTKEYIIKRELLFHENDSVSLIGLVGKFELSREQLINTRLFNSAEISLKKFDGYAVDVEVTVKERWYIFPVPYFNLVDRNFQAWADKNYSLSRINYGLKFIHFNTTGRKDKLQLFFITGYSRQFLLSYNLPYADKSLKFGAGVNGGYSAVKEVNINTVDNKQVFLKADSIDFAGKFLQENTIVNFGLNYRPKLFTNHSLQFSYHWDKVDPAVLDYNPTYLTKEGETAVNYMEIGYSMTYVKADYAAYMQKGLTAEINFLRRGITDDVGMWFFRANATKAWKMPHQFSYSANLATIVKLPFDQPYSQQKLFGYGDFYLRGLEKYVVDGAIGALARQTLRKQIANLSFKLPVLSSTHDHIPFRIFVKTYADAGLSYNKNSVNNPLDNKFLYTGGMGLDVVTLYDLVLRFEGSVNQKGETGFFFHVKNQF